MFFRSCLVLSTVLISLGRKRFWVRVFPVWKRRSMLGVRPLIRFSACVCGESTPLVTFLLVRHLHVYSNPSKGKRLVLHADHSCWIKARYADVEIAYTNKAVLVEVIIRSLMCTQKVLLMLWLGIHQCGFHCALFSCHLMWWGHEKWHSSC